MQTLHLDTKFHTIALTTDEDGRISIVIGKGTHPMQSPIIDVEIPCQEGPHKDSFKPHVHLAEGIEVEWLK